MGTNGVNGAKPPVTEALLLQKLQEAKASGVKAKIDEAKVALFDFRETHPKGGTKVEHAETQPLTAEQQEAKATAQQNANEEIAQMKAAAVIDKHESKADGKMATDTTALKGQERYANKEIAKTEFEVSGRKAGKIAKAARQNLEAMKSYDAVEKIFTDKKQYEAAVKAAKAEGKWDKEHPKYTLLEGKALVGAETLSMKAKESVHNALESYKKYAAMYENPNISAKDKDKAFEVMKKAAAYIARDYNASQMVKEDGSIDAEAYKKTMLQYTGADFKAGLDERKVLKGSAEVKNHTTKAMFEAAGLDVRLNYTGVKKAAAG